MIDRVSEPEALLGVAYPDEGMIECPQDPDVSETEDDDRDDDEPGFAEG